jgi:hypothetical protein
MKKLLAVFLVCVLTGCGTVGRSDAYSLGYEQGKAFKELGDYSKVIDSYDLSGDSSDDIPEVTPEGIQEVCAEFWLINGITAGLMNSTENKNEYLKGCKDGSN